MNRWREQMKVRTHTFTVDAVTFVKTLPDRTETRRLKDQLVGAACGVDGNWRAACRARSHKEFAAKLGVVVEEADEAEEWLDVIHDAKLSEADELKRLRGESKELRAIFAKASRTANENESAKREGRKVERQESSLRAFQPFRLPAFQPFRLPAFLPFFSAALPDFSFCYHHRLRVARRYLVSGRVQGVGFRYFAHATASREGLYGWVRNLPDGRVEAAAEGEADAIERFERALRHGPPGARVEQLEIEHTVPVGRDTGFTVT